MAAMAIKRTYRSMSAFLVASAIHGAIAIGFALMPSLDITPPQVAGGFEVVDLSAFGVAQPAAPEPVKEKVTEQSKVEPAPKPEPQPEPLPLTEPTTVAAPEPAPLPIVKAQPKPASEPNPVNPVKSTTPPQAQPAPTSAQAPKSVASPGSQSAFVPPSSTAAYLNNPKPAYPAMAQRRGMEGVVLLDVEVSVSGAPTSVTIKKSSGFMLLDQAALRAVNSWRFLPATKGGMPVEAGVEVPIRFVLNDV